MNRAPPERPHKKPGKPKKAKPKPTPALLEETLADPAKTRHWPEKDRDDAAKRLRRFRNRVFGHPHPYHGGLIEGMCCSHPWGEDCAQAGWDPGKIYPVGRHPRPEGEGGGATRRAVDSGRRQCRTCGTWYPKSYLGTSGDCVDCRLEGLPDHISRNLQHSSSVIDFHQLRPTQGRAFHD